MKIDRFEDMLVWQKSKQLATEVYRQFGNNKDYGFKDQIQRAAVSIPNNIAEGFERKGDKEFSHYLFMAKGSAAEVRSMLYIALDLGYLSQAQFDKFKNETTEISRMLSGFIKSLRA